MCGCLHICMLFDPKLQWSVGRTNCLYHSTRVDLYSHQILLCSIRDVVEHSHSVTILLFEEVRFYPAIHIVKAILFIVVWYAQKKKNATWSWRERTSAHNDCCWTDNHTTIFSHWSRICSKWPEQTWDTFWCVIKVRSMTYPYSIGYGFVVFCFVVVILSLLVDSCGPAVLTYLVSSINSLWLTDAQWSGSTLAQVGPNGLLLDHNQC